MADRANVHVVVVAYGSYEQLARCLGGLQSKYPVTVVDNSSSADVHKVVDRFGAAYVDPGQNLGFAAGVNRALARLDLAHIHVLVLNPDAVVSAPVVASLEAALQGAQQAACVAPAQFAPGSKVADRVCWPFPTPFGAWIDAVGLGRVRRRCDFLTGAVLLIRGSALLEVGGFDERFFLYAEETDWQQRARRQGFEVRYCRELTAMHVGAGTDPDAERRVLRFHAGTEQYIRKWHGILGWTAFRMANIVGASVRAMTVSATRRKIAVQRVRIYWFGPMRMATKLGALPPVGSTNVRVGR